MPNGSDQTVSVRNPIVRGSDALTDCRINEYCGTGSRTDCVVEMPAFPLFANCWNITPDALLLEFVEVFFGYWKYLIPVGDF